MKLFQQPMQIGSQKSRQIERGRFVFQVTVI